MSTEMKKKDRLWLWLTVNKEHHRILRRIYKELCYGREYKVHNARGGIMALHFMSSGSATMGAV